MKKLLAIIVALGLLFSTGSITALHASDDEDIYVSWGELLPPQN